MAHPSHPAPAPAGPGRPTRADREHEYSRLSPTLDPEQVLAELRITISHDNWSLEAVLQQIAEAAQTITCADGAAIAMWRDDAVICQGRAGDMAPQLGSQLDTQSGISGQCLRTGWSLRCDDTNTDTRVNAEVCRTLGLRSLAVVPVGRRPAVSGVLEAFSGLPYAFRNNQLELLEELAELALAAQRRAAEKPAPGISQRSSSDTVPAEVETSHQLRRQALRQAKRLLAAVRKSWWTPKAWPLPKRWVAAQGWLKQGLLVVGVAALALLGWFLFRGKGDDSSQAALDPAATNLTASRPPSVSAPATEQAESSAGMQVRNVKTVRSSKVVMASKTEKTPPTDDVVPQPVQAQRGSNLSIVEKPTAISATPKNQDADGENAPVLASASTGSEHALEGVLSAPPPLPQPLLPVSKGLTEGVLVRKIDPIYPPLARTMRLEGAVKLQATIAEDGTVRDVKVVSGPPMLAHAAQEAVTRWRYRPFLLNGKPVAMRTEIKVDFKLP
jgi:TonB family protein